MMSKQHYHPVYPVRFLIRIKTLMVVIKPNIIRLTYNVNLALVRLY